MGKTYLRSVGAYSSLIGTDSVPEVSSLKSVILRIVLFVALAHGDVDRDTKHVWRSFAVEHERLSDVFSLTRQHIQE